jgi:multiple sugar transport system ATP-binding protein
MATVEYRSIAKSFGQVKVIESLSLANADGEFAVLLGPSGCGKTTLLRMTAGLETVTAGELLIDGRRVNDLHPRDRDIAMVFQNYALYPTMKVYDNIAFALEVKRLPAAEIRRRVEAAAAVLNLTDYLGRYPRELSGGQRQRVAMGRAMVRDAKVFLFDEPLSNLDAKLRAHMRVEIRQLHDRLGTTTIYVTHDQIEAMTMADRIVLMRGGAIEQAGTPDELYDRPVSKYVADFIGSPAMNFLAGEIVAADGRPVLRAGELALPVPPDARVSPGQKVICGLRPQDLVLDPAGPIAGRLVLTEKTGADANLHLDVNGTDLVATVPRDSGVTPGMTVHLRIAPGRVHLFDGASERRC